MTASLNLPSSPIGGRTSNNPLQGMNQIKAKIFDFQQRYEELRINRSQDVSNLISTLDLSDLDNLLFLRVVDFFYLKENSLNERRILWKTYICALKGFV